MLEKFIFIFADTNSALVSSPTLAFDWILIGEIQVLSCKAKWE